MKVANANLDMLFDGAIYTEALLPTLRIARRQLRIATANIKDVWIESRSGYVPLVQLLVQKAEAGVRVQVLHCGGRSGRFQQRLTGLKLPAAFEMRTCRRNHMKCVLADGFQAYAGSANMTGAGLGAKSAARRNFEVGFLTRDLRLVRELDRQFERIWTGLSCATCRRRVHCPRLAASSTDF